MASAKLLRGRSKQPPIRFRAGDRVFVVGASGTGKTTLILAMLHELWRYYQVPTWIVNSKPDSTLTALGRKTQSFTISDTAPNPIRTFGLQMWKPTYNDPDLYDQYFEKILSVDRPGILIVDEVLSIVGNTRSQDPINFKRLLSQVRDKKITMIYGAQRKAGIPAECLNQAKHVFMFGLRDQYDVQTVAREMRVPQPVQFADEHGFFYTTLARIEEPRYYRDYRDLFGGS